MSNPLRRLLQPEPYLQSLHLLLDLPVGIAVFTVAVTLLTTGGSLAITLVGIPILAATVVGFRLVGAVERVRAELLLGHRVEGPQPFGRPARPGTGNATGTGTGGSGLVDLLRRSLIDAPGWKAVAYSLLMLPWGVIAFTLCVTVWSVAVSLIPSLVLAFAFADNFLVIDGQPMDTAPRVALALLLSGIGVGVLLAAPAVMAGLTAIDRVLVTQLLGPGRVEELEQRVEAVTESRDAALSGAASELARLERDLHDGTQQRLVGLAMELGVAKERLAGGEPAERVLPLVTAAHDSSKAAIAELRDLVRGVQPGVLADRGLDAALSGLAARSPIPVQVTVDTGPRPAPPVEAAAYFIVAEALTNAAKHSGAAHIRVDLRRVGDHLRLTIDDDGRGGAVISPVGGLGGMRDRARSVEGTLTVDSPPGGPTLIRAELPCGS